VFQTDLTTQMTTRSTESRLRVLRNHCIMVKQFAGCVTLRDGAPSNRFRDSSFWFHSTHTCCQRCLISWWGYQQTFWIFAFCPHDIVAHRNSMLA